MSLTKTLYFSLNSNTRESPNIIVYTKKCGDDNDEGTPYDAHSFTFKNIKNNVIYICEMLDETNDYTDTFNLYSSECSDAANEIEANAANEIENNEIEANGANEIDTIENIKVIGGAIIAGDKDIENKDIENKDIENKDIENKDIENKDIENEDADADAENDDDDNDWHPIGNIICQLQFNNNFKQYFHTNIDKFILKVQSQIYSDGLFQIGLSPEEEELLQGVVGLPERVITHMKENCETYFMVVFDAPEAADVTPEAELEGDDDAPDGASNDASDTASESEDTWILRKSLIYPIH